MPGLGAAAVDPPDSRAGMGLRLGRGKHICRCHVPIPTVGKPRVDTDRMAFGEELAQ